MKSFVHGDTRNLLDRNLSGVLLSGDWSEAAISLANEKEQKPLGAHQSPILIPCRRLKSDEHGPAHNHAFRRIRFAIMMKLKSTKLISAMWLRVLGAAETVSGAFDILCFRPL